VNEWPVRLTKRAAKDARNLSAAGLRDRAEILLSILRVDPFQSPPPYERLKGDMAGAYSRRINIQHRLVYEVREDIRLVVVLRMWSHYE